MGINNELYMQTSVKFMYTKGTLCTPHPKCLNKLDRAK